MDSLELAKLAQLFPGLLPRQPSTGLLGLTEGEWNASKKRLEPGDPMASLGNIPVPMMHNGKMFNLMNRARSDGAAQSLDFYLQPSISPKGGIGLHGGGLLYRKTY